jgi:hypothetical protein
MILLPAMMFALAITGCGADSSGMPGIDSTPDTGTVTFSIKDAPLSSLQTLTIDITDATLIGVGATSNYQVFPQSSSPAFVQVDLLSLQGIGQLLASASVPVGTYSALSLDFTNPQATDFANVPQNISAPTGFMVGLFNPPLTVTSGSLTSVMIDVDLSTAYHDLGGNNGLLTPVATLTVLNASTPPLPLRRFFGIVESINVAADSFDAKVIEWQPAGPPVVLGNVTVQCSATTVFNGPGGIVVGNTAAQLTQYDLVEIDGVLTASVIDASMVTLIGHGSSAQPPVAPPVNFLAGTIIDVNTTTSTVTVRVQWNVGPTQQPYTDVVVDIVATTSIHRGATVVQLGDLVQGNFCHVQVDPQTQEAIDVDEGPAFVCGTVVAVNIGGGVGGTDRVEFTPDTVNQIPAAQLTFVPATLFVDLPTGHPIPPVSSQFCVFAFFDGTAVLTLAQSGGRVGVPPHVPPPPPANYFVLAGQLETGTTATVNTAGDVEFSLTAFDHNTMTMQDFDVTVTSAATMTLFDATGVTPLTTAAAASAAINQNPTALIQVAGTAAPAGLAFTADLSLDIFVNSGGGTFPGPTPPPPPAFDVAAGLSAGNAIINVSGDIEFTLLAHPGPNAPALAVTVRQTAVLELFSSSGAPTVLTVAQAVAELNASPAPFVQLAGTLSGPSFDAHIGMQVFR